MNVPSFPTRTVFARMSDGAHAAETLSASAFDALAGGQVFPAAELEVALWFGLDAFDESEELELLRSGQKSVEEWARCPSPEDMYKELLGLPRHAYKHVQLTLPQLYMAEAVMDADVGCLEDAHIVINHRSFCTQPVARVLRGPTVSGSCGWTRCAFYPACARSQCTIGGGPRAPLCCAGSSSQDRMNGFQFERHDNATGFELVSTASVCR